MMTGEHVWDAAADLYRDIIAATQGEKPEARQPDGESSEDEILDLMAAAIDRRDAEEADRASRVVMLKAAEDGSDDAIATVIARFASIMAHNVDWDHATARERIANDDLIAAIEAGRGEMPNGAPINLFQNPNGLDATVKP